MHEVGLNKESHEPVTSKESISRQRAPKKRPREEPEDEGETSNGVSSTGKRAKITTSTIKRELLDLHVVTSPTTHKGAPEKPAKKRRAKEPPPSECAAAHIVADELKAQLPVSTVVNSQTIGNSHGEKKFKSRSRIQTNEKLVLHEVSPIKKRKSDKTKNSSTRYRSIFYCQITDILILD